MARLFDDAASQYLEINQAVIAACPLTIAFWFNSDDVTNNQDALCIAQDDDADRYYSLGPWGNGAGATSVTLFRRKDSTVATATTTSYLANTWHHACAVCAADDDAAMFLDAGGKNTSAVSVVPTGWDRTRIGSSADSSPTNYMSGSLADIAVWSAALTDAEVGLLARGIPPVAILPWHLISYWDLVGDDRDKMGPRYYHMTPVNNPSWAAHPPKVLPWKKRLWHYGNLVGHMLEKVSW